MRRYLGAGGCGGGWGARGDWACGRGGAQRGVVGVGSRGGGVEGGGVSRSYVFLDASLTRLRLASVRSSVGREDLVWGVEGCGREEGFRG